jgi:hypothetical protein
VITDGREERAGEKAWPSLNHSKHFGIEQYEFTLVSASDCLNTLFELAILKKKSQLKYDNT